MFGRMTCRPNFRFPRHVLCPECTVARTPSRFGRAYDQGCRGGDTTAKYSVTPFSLFSNRSGLPGGFSYDAASCRGPLGMGKPNKIANPQCRKWWGNSLSKENFKVLHDKHVRRGGLLKFLPATLPAILGHAIGLESPRLLGVPRPMHSNTRENGQGGGQTEHVANRVASMTSPHPPTPAPASAGLPPLEVKRFSP